MLVEQRLRQGRVVHLHEQVAQALAGAAALAQLLVKPRAAVEADADAEGEPALDADVAQPQALVLEVVVVVQALADLLAGLDQTPGVLAQAVGGTGLDATEHGHAALAWGPALRQLQGGGFLVRGGAVQGEQGDVLLLGQGFGAPAQLLGQLLGMVGEVLEEDALLPEIALDAAGMVEQAGLAGQAQAVEAGQDEENEGAEAR